MRRAALVLALAVVALLALLPLWRDGPRATPPPFLTEEANASVTLRLHLEPLTPVRGLELSVALPVEIPGRQELIVRRTSHPIVETTHRTGNNVATFVFDALSEPVELEIVSELRVAPYSVHRPPPRRELRPEEAARYRLPTTGIESGHEELRFAAAAIEGEGRSWVENALSWAVRRVECPGLISRRVGALETLRGGLGDCSDMTDLLVALCRANGRPARHAYGLTLDHGATMRHSWAEVWDELAGWLPIDPLYVKLRRERFGELSRDRVQLMNTDDDEALAPEWYYRWACDEGRLRVRYVPRLLAR